MKIQTLEDYKCPACKSVGYAQLTEDKTGKYFTCECGHEEAVNE